MKTYKMSNINKVFLTLLCAFFLNFKGECAEDIEMAKFHEKNVSPSVDRVFGEDLEKIISCEVLSESTRKAIPNMTGFISLMCGDLTFLQSLSVEGVKAIGTTGCCINLLGAVSNLYNWYKDRDGIKGVAHNALNGLIILSNVTSASLGFASLYGTEDPYEQNALGVASLVVGASGLFFKGIDLFLTESPSETHRCKMARRNSSTNVLR
jgi:hypothetical protein